MLLSDEQRDNACALLRDQYGAGRMTLEDYSARIDKVLAARDTNQLALAFKGLEAPALLAPLPLAPQLVPRWVTAVSGLGVALAAAELVTFLVETVLDQKNLEGGCPHEFRPVVASLRIEHGRTTVWVLNGYWYPRLTVLREARLNSNFVFGTGWWAENSA